MTALGDYFRARGVALTQVTPGAVTPARFTGAAAEHMGTRTACGLFDFSFMACVEIRGTQSLAFLHRLQTRNLTGLARGRIAYTLMLRADGCVLGDATVWCFDDDHYALFMGRREDVAHVNTIAVNFAVTLTERTDNHAVLALQGVRAWRILAKCIDGPPTELPYFGFWSAAFRGHPCWIARIGYAGETGYEIVCNAQQAPLLWDALKTAGEPLALRECGFDAVNSLRIEAGHVLFNAELAQPVTPDELGLSRLLDSYPHDFIGKNKVPIQQKHAMQPHLAGLLPQVEGRSLRTTDGVALIRRFDACGVRITSAAYSPVLKRVIAMGFVNSGDAAPGTRLRLADGLTVEVARLPFYDPAKYLARRTR